MDGSSYLRPYRSGSAEITEKRSRFLARVEPVESESEALAFLDGLRRSERDATHHVYVYGLRDGALRYSDDGEPHGSSAMPVLTVFRGAGVTDFCCVVTRWFGGTLLGVGGLQRAYSAAAAAALRAAGTAEVRLWTRLGFTAPYSFYDRLCRCIEDCGASAADSEFTDRVRVTALVPAGGEAELLERVRDMSAGGVLAETLGTALLPRLLRAPGEP